MFSNLTNLFKQSGFLGVASAIVEKYGLELPLHRKTLWHLGKVSEIKFWDSYYRSKGMGWGEKYWLKFDPDLPLQPRVASLLQESTEPKLLDVGAGPMTYLGKVYKGRRLNITAIDPLADDYNRILNKYYIVPNVRTEKLAAEKITSKFNSNEFDLVFARNCLDHSYNPEKAIMQMLDVVKKGCYLLLEHHPNEAEHEGYKGLHKWNFFALPNGDFIINSKFSEINMTKKHRNRCTIKCEVINEDQEWVITRIKKL